MSQNIYGWHIANMTYTAIMLQGHMDQEVFHLCAKTKPPTISTSHATVMYVPETNTVCPSNAPYMQITSYEDMRQLCQYI